MEDAINPTSPHAQAQRERILEAAEACFIEHGFRAATMANIALRSGISPGLIYRYFENKQAVILASIERHLARNRRALDQMDASMNLATSLREAFPLWRDGSPQVWHVALICEAVAESGRDPEVAAALRRSFVDARQGLEQWIRLRDEATGTENAGDPPRTPPPARALMLQCLIEGLLIRAYCEPDLDPGLLVSMLEQAMATITPGHAHTQ